MELQSISKKLEQLVPKDKILVAQEVGSTMDEVRRFESPNKDESGFKGVVVSLSQTAGRGRQGRNWISKQGAGVYLSAIFGVQFEDQSLFGILPLMVGLKLKEKLEVISSQIKLKWPNDLVVDTETGIKKLAGLLLEAVHEGKSSVVTIGVGVNLKKSLVDNAYSLEELSPGIWNVADLAALVLDSVLQAVSSIESVNVESFLEDYNSSLVFKNQKISLLEGEGKSLSGINRGIDRDGSLLLETANGILKLYSGDVHQGLANNE